MSNKHPTKDLNFSIYNINRIVGFRIHFTTKNIILFKCKYKISQNIFVSDKYRWYDPVRGKQ